MVPRNLPLASKRSRRSSHLARQPHLPLKLARADTTLSAETMSIDHVASHPGPGGPCIWSSPVQSSPVFAGLRHPPRAYLSQRISLSSKLLPDRAPCCVAQCDTHHSAS